MVHVQRLCYTYSLIWKCNKSLTLVTNNWDLPLPFGHLKWEKSQIHKVPKYVFITENCQVVTRPGCLLHRAFEGIQ